MRVPARQCYIEDVGIEVGPGDFPSDPDYITGKAVLLDIRVLAMPVRLRSIHPLRWVYNRIRASKVITGSWYEDGELLLGWDPNSELAIFDPNISSEGPYLAKTTKKSIHPQYITTDAEKLRIAIHTAHYTALATLLEHAHPFPAP